MPLTILTLNIWNTDGPYRDRRQRIREWIARLDPDVIGFQEVLRGPGIDQLADLTDGFGYHTDFVEAVPFWRDATLQFGNALASRWPIAERQALRLPDAGDGERRIALSVTIDAPFGPLGFTVTHLNWKPHHGWVREQQVVAVCALARRLRPRGGFPPVIVGDFNAVPESSEIRYVTGLHALAGGSVHFRDAWAVAGDGSGGVTWSNRNPFARAAAEPDRRIDYIFVGPPAARAVGAVERCAVVCDQPRAGIFPSDHFGLLVTLRTEPLEQS